jgi:AraC-like DNA-binding protein
MSKNILTIVLLLGAAQGILLTVLISHRHSRLFANRFLGFLMLFYSLILLNLISNDLGYYRRFPHLMLIPISLPFLIGPLHFLYAKYLIRSAKKFKAMDWLHVLPFAFYLLYLLPYFLKPGEVVLAAFQNPEENRLTFESLFFNWAIILQGLTYMVLTIIIVRRYSRHIRDMFSAVEKIQLNWLRNITYMVLFVLSIFAMENVLFLAGINLSNFFNFTSVLFAVAVYAMGYLGLSKSEIFADSRVAESIRQLPRLIQYFTVEKEAAQQKTAPKYEKSGLSPEKAREYQEALLNLMKDKKPYRNSELTLNQLAEMLTISPHNLSEVINVRLEQNFFDFVNLYRVEEVKEDLADPAKQHLKILSLAFDAGFNSKSSFNAIFKKHTGLTPSEYRNNL